MRGSLRISHVAVCPASEGGRARDARACRCSPAVQARVAGVHRSLGHLPVGWRVNDLIPLERELADLRALVLEGRTPPRPKIVTLTDWAIPWLEGIAAQVEAGRMSPLTYNHYEGAWRLYLQPELGRLPLPAITYDQLIRFMRGMHARGLGESRVKGALIPLSGMLTDAVSEGLIANNRCAPRAGLATAAGTARSSSIFSRHGGHPGCSNPGRRSSSSPPHPSPTSTSCWPG